MLNTPEQRTQFIRDVTELNDNSSIWYGLNPMDFGYRDLDHFRDELYEQDRELCFRYFPNLRKVDQENETQSSGISTNYNVGCGGGSSAC